ncbi:MAG: hypothetical protein ACYCTL_13515 [Acidimicrobiales bacterium]
MLPIPNLSAGPEGVGHSVEAVLDEALEALRAVGAVCESLVAQNRKLADALVTSASDENGECVACVADDGVSFAEWTAWALRGVGPAGGGWLGPGGAVIRKRDTPTA